MKRRIIFTGWVAAVVLAVVIHEAERYYRIERAVAQTQTDISQTIINSVREGTDWMEK